MNRISSVSDLWSGYNFLESSHQPFAEDFSDLFSNSLLEIKENEEFVCKLQMEVTEVDLKNCSDFSKNPYE